MNDAILVTGGAGFIGSNFVLDWIQQRGTPVINLDLLTYAGNAANLQTLEGDTRHIFVRGDICDAPLVKSLLEKYQPRALVHFAAESHVDRSLVSPDTFIQTNVFGTFTLLRQAHEYWNRLTGHEREQFRFLHVSTDEVYGTLDEHDPAFSETTAYAPNSPYAASKASSDHLVRAWHHTWGLPVLTTNCSNNYGPFQFPEKLIPLMILNALEGKPLPVYGDGLNVRDWLFVGDHCTAIREVLERGRPGETYNVGGSSERANIDVVTTICDLLDEMRPNAGIGPRRNLITYVTDRPGHDRRYAINATKITHELSWHPLERFESGIRRTVAWYLDHLDWVNNVRSGAYQQWIEHNYAERLGTERQQTEQLPQ
ncbi:dTDP-glucose 4,6-dehydratase [Paracidobacterium acidisoli]|uniref:dTDP-glucose 4,6-dehydratase n=1 Tax=Paracidobacterium acidisoli TaxID=2303751 RepID=A0A372IUT0_9BACT|nr:dTDP-glucose 4,6-dehydratase [Paracidobacterium acidisoli]MBT9329703.1 dTDP-glucose 4,6-dehydratase [Paracidobacterium acidisoli]